MRIPTKVLERRAFTKKEEEEEEEKRRKKDERFCAHQKYVII
jgi:hypothetical protein